MQWQNADGETCGRQNPDELQQPGENSGANSSSKLFQIVGRPGSV
jgi:hypothetical protein